MVDQLPNLGREAEMLSAMGYASMDDLFSDVPADVRMDDLPLRGPQTEEIIAGGRLLGANVPLGSMASFIGAAETTFPPRSSAGHAWRVPDRLHALPGRGGQGMLPCGNSKASSANWSPRWPTSPSTTAPPQRPKPSPAPFGARP